MPHASYVGFVTNVGPRPHTDISITRAIEVTLPTPTLLFQCMRIHSSILIHPSIAYAIIASQRFMSRHEAVVVSFDMSGDRPRFEGRPAKGSRPPRIKQSQGRKN